MPEAENKVAEWASLPEIAAMFDLSEERCRQLVRRGIWERRQNGDLRIRTCVNMYQLLLSHSGWFRENFQ
jgi:hypothetical protein